MKVKTSSNTPSRSPRGFTLVELLVVITIIVVLAAVGLPTMSKMRASANRTKCMENLRSWGVMMASYAAENDGGIEVNRWTSTGSTNASVYLPYMTGASVDTAAGDYQGSDKRLYEMRRCPAIKFTPTPGNNGPVSYAMIRTNPPVPNVTKTFLSKITNPSRFMLMIEATPGSYYIGSGNLVSRVKPLTVKGDDLRHNGTVNSLMGDFSVRSMTWKDIEKGLAYWDVY